MNPAGNPPTVNPPFLHGGQGFFFDPIRAQYIIEDPTGVRTRPFNSPISKQPYAGNLSRALEHRWLNIRTIRQVTILKANDSAFWMAFCRAHGPNIHNANSASRRAALRNLP